MAKTRHFAISRIDEWIPILVAAPTIEARDAGDQNGRKTTPEEEVRSSAYVKEDGQGAGGTEPASSAWTLIYFYIFVYHRLDFNNPSGSPPPVGRDSYLCLGSPLQRKQSEGGGRLIVKER